MKTKLSVTAAFAGTLLATCLVSGSAQATSLPVPKGEAHPSIVTLIGEKGGHYAYKGKRHHYDYRSRYGWWGAPEPLLRVHRVLLNLKCSYISRHSRISFHRYSSAVRPPRIAVLAPR